MTKYKVKLFVFPDPLFVPSQGQLGWLRGRVHKKLQSKIVSSLLLFLCQTKGTWGGFEEDIIK